MSKYPSQMQDKFNLRFPDGMRDAIAERAKRNGRSMNSEIVQILEDALDTDIKGAEPLYLSEHGKQALKTFLAELAKDMANKKPT